MKNNQPLLLLFLAVLLFLSACTSTPKPESQPAEDQSQGEAVEDVDAEQVQMEQEAVGQEEIEQVELEPAGFEMDAAALFDANCARCHAADRTGGRGPALLPSELNQDASVYARIILDGRSGMPAFGNKLSEEEISALADFILTEPQ